MTKAEMIEKLKDPKQAQPFGVLQAYHPKQAEILTTAGKANLLTMYAGGKWKPPINDGSSLYLAETYILADSYKPEPELEKRPVEMDSRGQCIVNVPGITCRLNIRLVEGYAKFADWEDEAGGLRDLGGVRKLKRDGKEAYATFFVKE